MRPGDETELAEIVASAREPFLVRGGGTRLFGARDDLTPISTRGIDGIPLYDPGSLTLVASTGAVVADVKSLLAGNGQRLPF